MGERGGERLNDEVRMMNDEWRRGEGKSESRKRGRGRGKVE
jgi:hypothetical protein